MYIKRKPATTPAVANATASGTNNIAPSTSKTQVNQTFYEDDTTKGTKSQGFSEENAADFEKVRKSAEETPEKVHEKKQSVVSRSVLVFHQFCDGNEYRTQNDSRQPDAHSSSPPS